MTIYARKGEVSTCEKGHPLGTFLRDVKVGALPSWDNDIKLAPGMKFGELKCPTCGGATHAAIGAMYFGAGNARGLEGVP